jgi:hypothetical protein
MVVKKLSAVGGGGRGRKRVVNSRAESVQLFYNSHLGEDSALVSSPPYREFPGSNKLFQKMHVTCTLRFFFFFPNSLLP